MTYARQLQQTFPDLDPHVEDLFLLEAHQIADLPDRAPPEDLAAVLHEWPAVLRFFIARHPPIEAFLRSVMAANPSGPDRDLPRSERALLWEIADWIVFQRMPDRYDQQVRFEPGRSSIEDVAPVDGRFVIDAGAGTGQVTFAVAPSAEYVLAVEPVAALRRYIREKAEEAGIVNVFVADGRLDAIPVAPSSADVLLTRQAIGWSLEAELDEVDRVLRPGGMALHLVGMPHPAPSDDALHLALVANGYHAGSYIEAGVAKRRYWKRRGES